MDENEMNFRLERENGGWVIYFEEYKRANFIKRGLVIYLDEDDYLIKMFYNSSEYGTVYWTPADGFSGCHSWESEDQAMDGSFLKRMYPSITHNGAESVHFARMIEKDILTGISNVDVLGYIEYIKENHTVPVELGRLNPGQLS